MPPLFCILQCRHSADVYEPGESVWVAWEPTSNSSYFDITLLYDGVQVQNRVGTGRFVHGGSVWNVGGRKI